MSTSGAVLVLRDRVVALLGEVPVDPDAETARAWVEAELTDPAYHQRPSLLTTLITWLLEQWSRAQEQLAGLDAGTAAIAVASAGALVALIAVLVTGPVARARRAAGASAEVFGDDTRSASQLRAAADAHALAGRWDAAVLDRFRAVVRAMEERVLIDALPGRTAHEVAETAGLRLPLLRDDLTSAGRLFDAVCYGHAAAGEQDDARLRALDVAVAAARPAPAPVEQVAG